MPLFSGRLLVSRSHAVFCRIPDRDVKTMEAVLKGEQTLDALHPELLADLDRHGFFGPPRPEKPDPTVVQIQLTNACNLACTYCCTNSGRARCGELTQEEVNQVLKQVRQHLGPGGRVAFLGGEPLLVPWALDAVSHALDLELEATLFSNGLPMADPAAAARVAQLNRRGLRLRVSLAGPDAASCDAHSGASRFETALTALAHLAAAGGMATIDLMLFPQDVDAAASRMGELRKRLPSGFPIAFGLAYLSGRETGEHLFVSRYDLEKALDRIAFEAGEVIAATQPSPLAYRREGCGCAMGHHLHVRSDGALFPCFKMEEFVGHLRREGFDAALQAVRSHPHPASDLPLCRDCPLATLCGAGCRSDNFLYTTNGDMPPCGPWRVRVLCELLAEDWVPALEWPVHHLAAEARRRGIEAPEHILMLGVSRHCVEV